MRIIKNSCFYIALMCIVGIFYQAGADSTFSYPNYIGTKKCEIIPATNITIKKVFPIYADSDTPLFYLWGSDIFQGDKIYTSDVDMIYLELKGNVIYGKQENGYIDIYKNHDFLLRVEGLGMGGVWYDLDIDRYNIEVWVNGEHMVFSNGKLIPIDDFLYHTRYTSQNKKYAVDIYASQSQTQFIQDGKIILQSDEFTNVRDMYISHDGEKVAFIVYDTTLGTYVGVSNGEIFAENVYFFQYAPNGKDLYYMTYQGNYESFTFYKNGEEVFYFPYKVYNTIEMQFQADGGYSFFLTDWGHYALIEDGNIIQSYNDPIQLRAEVIKANGDELKIIRDMEAQKDTLYINDEPLIVADRIDERYLRGGVDTFSLYPNTHKETGEYYTYVTQGDEYNLIINGYIVPNFSDYLQLHDGLDYFEFASYQGRVSCRDITNMYGELASKKQTLQHGLDILMNLDPVQTKKLSFTLKKMLQRGYSDIQHDIIQMMLDAIDQKNIQIYMKK